MESHAETSYDTLAPARFLSANDSSALRTAQNTAYISTAILYGLIGTALFLLSYAWQANSQILALPLYAFCFVLIGWCQFSLSNGFHEAVHNNFGSPQHALLAGLLLAYPIGLTYGYRKIHFDHHRFAGDPAKDPDYRDYASFPETKKDFLKRLFLNASGWPAVWQALNLYVLKKKQATPQDSGKKRQDNETPLLVLTQITILTLFTIFLHPVLYFLFWLAPVLTVGKLCSSTRLLCEHGSPDRKFVIRTITGPWYHTKTLGMFNFHYHAEHHIYPWIPEGRLSDAARLRTKKMEDPDYAAVTDSMCENWNRGYFPLLLHWYKNLP